MLTRIITLISLVGLVITAAGSAFAGTSDEPVPPRRDLSPGRIVGTGLIHLWANDEAKNGQLYNVSLGIEQLEGTRIAPGEIFSFNHAAHLLGDSIPYALGPDVSNNLVRAGGVCLLSTMVATAAADAGLPFINAAGRMPPPPRLQPHSRYFAMYHQVNWVGGRYVPIVEAAVAIVKEPGEPWRTVQDLRFLNNTDRTLVLDFDPQWSVADLNLTQPLAHTTKNFTLRVELCARADGSNARRLE